jgi:hypothetical protein
MPEPIQPPGPPGAGRPAAARYPCSLRTSCRVALGPAGDAWAAQVRDLSAGGVALALRRRFEPGTLLAFALRAPDGACAADLLARVVRAAAQPDGGWLLGCAFVGGGLGEEEVRALADPARPAAPGGPAWVRFRVRVEASCQTVGESPPRSWPVTVVDASPGGLGLLAPCRLERDWLLKVGLPGDPGRPARDVLVRVRHLRAVAGGWHVGCAFAAEFGPEELAALL